MDYVSTSSVYLASVGSNMVLVCSLPSTGAWLRWLHLVQGFGIIIVTRDEREAEREIYHAGAQWYGQRYATRGTNEEQRRATKTI
jgi:hypothetical protein